jgi:hypothetical protein
VASASSSSSGQAIATVPSCEVQQGVKTPLLNANIAFELRFDSFNKGL